MCESSVVFDGVVNPSCNGKRDENTTEIANYITAVKEPLMNTVPRSSPDP